MSEWISVHDELPSDGELVIVYETQKLSDGRIRVYPMVARYDAAHGRFYCPMDDYQETYVDDLDVHWM